MSCHTLYPYIRAGSESHGAEAGADTDTAAAGVGDGIQCPCS